MIYTGVFGLISLMVIFFLWQTFFTTTPTCFDGIENGTEIGVDCGGSCARVCTEVARSPAILWKRFLPNGNNMVTAVAEVSNENQGAGAHGVPYTFSIYDADNNLIVQKKGNIDLPPVPKIVIVEPNIDVGLRTPAQIQFSFDSLPIAWETVTVPGPVLRVISSRMSQTNDRLSATIGNGTITDAGPLVVVGMLFGADNNVLAASRSALPGLSKKSTKEVDFTWPVAATGAVRSEVIILPSF